MTELIWIPKKVMNVVGLSRLWATNGTPRVLHSLSTMEYGEGLLALSGIGGSQYVWRG